MTDVKRQRAEEELSKLFAAHNPSNDAPSQKTVTALHMKLVELSESAKKEAVETPSRFGWFKIATSFAVVALIVVSVLLFKSHPDVNSDFPDSSRHLIAQSEVKPGPITISLNFDAPEALNGVHFAISLPDGVHFDTANKELATVQHHEWENSLKRGDNTIPFVVALQKSGVYTISVTAEYGGFQHTQEIVLTATEKSVKIAYYIRSKKPITKFGT